MKYYLLAIFVFAIGVAGCHSSSTEPSNTVTTGRITVVVTDSVTHKPLENARVYLYLATSHDTTERSIKSTNSSGSVLFDTLPPGVYYVLAIAAHYYDFVTRVEVQAGSDLHVSAPLPAERL